MKRVTTQISAGVGSICIALHSLTNCPPESSSCLRLTGYYLQHIPFGKAFPRLCHVYLCSNSLSPSSHFKHHRSLHMIFNVSQTHSRATKNSKSTGMILGGLVSVLWSPHQLLRFHQQLLQETPSRSQPWMRNWHLDIRRTGSQLTLPTFVANHDQASDAKLSGSGSGDIEPIDMDLPLSISA